jgi:hypothetical protein
MKTATRTFAVIVGITLFLTYSATMGSVLNISTDWSVVYIVHNAIWGVSTIILFVLSCYVHRRFITSLNPNTILIQIDVIKKSMSLVSYIQSSHFIATHHRYHKSHFLYSTRYFDSIREIPIHRNGASMGLAIHFIFVFRSS